MRPIEMRRIGGGGAAGARRGRQPRARAAPGDIYRERGNRDGR